MASIENTKLVVDGFSLATLVGTFASYLPSTAALLTIVWTALRIWQDPLVISWRTGDKPP